jgi:hypothetical protein
VSDAPERVLVIFVDALGPSQLRRFGDLLPELPHRQTLAGILGYSSGALPTILTGTPPAIHGRMCLFTARPPGQPSILGPLQWLGLLPRVVHERERLRRVLGQALARARGLTGYVALHRVPPEAFAWLDLPEREDLFAAASVGGAPTFLAEARQAGLEVFASPWQTREADRWDETHRRLGRRPPDLAFLYAAELDAVLHREGNAGPRARDAIGRIASHVLRAREAMVRDGKPLTTLLVGDHGMADVDTMVDPRGVLKELADLRYFVDSTMLRVWGDDRALGSARRLIEAARFPGQWLDEVALDARAAPTKDAPYGRGMFVLDEGAIFAPSFTGGRVLGMHGYDIGTGSAVAALASDRPIPPTCDALVSIAPLVRSRLGLG